MAKILRKCFLLVASSVLLFNCDNEHKEFQLNSIKLKSYKKSDNIGEKLYFRVVDGGESDKILATTDRFSANSTMPILLGLDAKVRYKLYSEPFLIQLVSDSTNVIGSTFVNMDEYKIVFPIDMEIENEEMDITISGSWH